jgi:hypothetical protein
VKRPRIALCFSGQLRAWRKALPTIKEFISLFPHDPDIFMHVWNFNSTSHGIEKDPAQDIVIDLVDDKEIQDCIEELSPKKYVIEDYKTCELITGKTWLAIKNMQERYNTKEPTKSVYWLAPQYYGVSKASLLREEFEDENEFYYDCVIRMRYDTYFTKEALTYFSSHFSANSMEPFTLYGTHMKYLDGFPGVSVGDIFFCADSMTYSLASQYVDHLPHVDEALNGRSSPNISLTPEHYFSFFLRSLFLNLEHLEFLDPKIARSAEYFKRLTENGRVPYGCDI